MDARDDGRAYGTYDHEMRMEYEEDEQGDPAVDDFGRRVVAGADPWAPVRRVVRDLRRWVNALPLAPGRALRAHFDILYDEGDDVEAVANDGRMGASGHAKRLGGRQLTGDYARALEAELWQAIEDPDEDTPSGSMTPPTKLRMFVKVDSEAVDGVELVGLDTQPARRGRPGASHEDRSEEGKKRRGSTASGRAPPGQRRLVRGAPSASLVSAVYDAMYGHLQGDPAQREAIRALLIDAYQLGEVRYQGGARVGLAIGEGGGDTQASNEQGVNPEQGWNGQCESIEALHSVRLTVYGADRRVLRVPSKAAGKAAGAPLALLCEPGGWSVLTNASAWAQQHALHRCEGCGFASLDRAKLDRHLKAGACLRCPECRTRFATADALAQHLAAARVAPCAPVARSARRVRAKVPPRLQHDVIVWDSETKQDAHGKCMAVMVQAKLSPRLASLVDGVDLARACPVAHDGVRYGLRRVVLDTATRKYVLDEGDAHASPIVTTCAVHLPDLADVAKVVFEQLLALLDYLEGRCAQEHKWEDNACNWATFYVLRQWYFETFPEAAAAAAAAVTAAAADATVADAAAAGVGGVTDEADVADVADAASEAGDEASEASKAAAESVAAESEEDGEVVTRLPSRGRWRDLVAALRVREQVGSAASRAHARFERSAKLAVKVAFFQEHVEPALKRAGFASTALLRAMREGAEPAMPYLRAHRRAVWERERVRKYRANRAGRPILLIAHNSAKFDSVILLDHLQRTGRLDCEKAAMAGDDEAVVAGDVAVAAAEADEGQSEVQRGEGVRLLDVGSSKFISITYKGMFHFRDSCRHLAHSLDELCTDFAKAGKIDVVKDSGSFPLKWLQMAEGSWRDEELACKPPRSAYTVLGKPSGPGKHRRQQLLDVEEYRKVPGRDPDADRHGEGTFNPYRQLLHYCALDVESLAQVWAAWRDVMLQATSYDGGDVPPAHAARATAHAAGGTGNDAHAPLIEATVTHTTLSIDGGTKNLGYSVVRETVTPLFCGASAVLTSATPLDARRLQLVVSGVPRVALLTDATDDPHHVVRCGAATGPLALHAACAVEVAGVRYHFANAAPERAVLAWGRLGDVGLDAGPALRAVAAAWCPLDSVLVEEPMLVNKRLCDQVASIVRAFPQAHRVDAGWPKTMDPGGRPTVVPDDEKHATNKRWAVDFAAALLRDEGVAHPPPPVGKADDVADATLQAIWFLRTHRARAGQRVVSTCPLLNKRFHTHGIDPNAHLTAGQCTVATLLTELTATELLLGERREVVHRKPRFLPRSQQPQSPSELCLHLGVMDIEMEAFLCDGPPPCAGMPFVPFRDVPWGAIECADDLAPAVAALVPDDAEAAMATLRGRDVHLPILHKAKDDFCREATYGGRVDIFEHVFELPEAREAAACPECGGGLRRTKKGKWRCEACDDDVEPDEASSPWQVKFFDINSQYPGEMLKDLPCGDGAWLGEAECAALDLDSFYGFVRVDVEVEKRHPWYGRYPTLPERVDGQLQWNCHDKRGVVYFSEELKAAVARGCRVLKVHQALRFNAFPALRSYIQVFQKLKQDEDAKGARKNNCLRNAYKLLMNSLYGKLLQRVRLTESRVCSKAQLLELVYGAKPLHRLPRIINENCFALTLEKQWSAARLPSCQGSAILGNSKVTWYALLEAGLRVGAVPIEGDTDSIMLAFPDAAALRTFEGCGQLHESEFGKAKDELPEYTITGAACPTQKFYVLKLADAAGSPIMEGFLPQTLEDWRAALRRQPESALVHAMRREVDEALTKGDCRALAPLDLVELELWWAKRVGSDGALLRSVLAATQVEWPTVYCKCKGAPVRGNESETRFEQVKRLALGTMAPRVPTSQPELAEELRVMGYAPGEAAPGAVPSLEAAVTALLGAEAAAPAVKRLRAKRAYAEVARTTAGTHDLQVAFTTSTLAVTGVNRKRYACERDHEWEAAHRVACRRSTLPHGYVGPV